MEVVLHCPDLSLSVEFSRPRLLLSVVIGTHKLPHTITDLPVVDLHRALQQPTLFPFSDLHHVSPSSQRQTTSLTRPPTSQRRRLLADLPAYPRTSPTRPEFQETFYEDIVYPYRQKNKILLKRGTPASFATLTRNLLRAYGQRVWGNRSHWLIGGARDGTERKVTRMSRDRAATQTQKSESGSAVNGEENGRGAEDREEATTPATAKATTTARIEEDGEDVEGAEQQGAAEREGEDLEDDGFGEEYWAARGYRGPLNEWGKPTYVNARNVMWTPDDIAIQDLVNDGEDAGEPNESTQEEQKEGSEAEDEIEMEDEAEVDVASLYFEVPKDKEKSVLSSDIGNNS